MSTGHDTVGYRGVSSTSHPFAAAAEIGALLGGGNAVDAAVASGFALSVVEPSMSAMKPQGNCIVFIGGDETPTAVDSLRSPREAGGEDSEVGTTYHSHVGRWSNIVAITQSLGDAFGSAIMAQGLGFFWNNTMKLVDPRPGTANLIQPGKRSSTAPCPVLVTRGGLAFHGARERLGHSDHQLQRASPASSPRRAEYAGGSPFAPGKLVRDGTGS